MARGMGWTACVAVVTALVAASPLAAQDIAMDGTYRQSAEVRARFPDLKVPFVSPAAAHGRHTTQAELERFLADLATPTAPLQLTTLTTTAQGRAVPLAILTPERITNPTTARTLGRPIVWILGQQHGNEPAGGEAALALIHALSAGELRPLLQKLTIFIAPRMNPDGAAADQRDTALGLDPNRDHAAMLVPETRALHDVVRLAPPDLVLDLHEFSVANRWLQKFNALQAVDLMLLDATHPMVPDTTKRLARDLFLPAAQASAAMYGLTTFDYHTTSTRSSDRAVALGGNAPGIARNAFGLSGAVSFLLETRGVGIGLEGYQRRVATHVLTVSALLGAAADRADHLRDTVAAARREITARQTPLVVGHQAAIAKVSLPLLDPTTGATKTIDVDMTDSRRLIRRTERARPAGYLLIPPATDALADLRLLGAASCRLTTDTELDGEMFELRERRTVDRRAINPDAAVKAELRAARIAAPAGSLFVPMAQPAGNRIAAALEPDTPGSWVAVGVVTVPPGTDTIPIMRIVNTRGLDLVAADPGAVCTMPE